MIYEMARIKIAAENCETFEKLVQEAAPLFKASKGCKSMRLEKVLENKGEYILRVGWESLENHTIDFREGESFQKWRALVGPLFIEPPNVTHDALISEYF